MDPDPYKMSRIRNTERKVLGKIVPASMTPGTSLSPFHRLILNMNKKIAIYLQVYGKENPKQGGN
jgi:hypothetical protein